MRWVSGLVSELYIHEWFGMRIIRMYLEEQNGIVWMSETNWIAVTQNP